MASLLGRSRFLFGPRFIVSESNRPARAALIVTLLALVVAAFLPALGRTDRVRLNFGPGDSAYIAGFAPDHEVEDKRGTHWTTYHATVQLPVALKEDSQLILNFRRVFAEEAQVVVRQNGDEVAHFSARGGALRTVDVPLRATTAPLEINIDTDSHERRDRGLQMDELVVVSSARTMRLAGGGRWRLLLSLGALVGALTLFSRRGRGLQSLAVPVIAWLSVLAFAWRAHADLFAAVRQCDGIVTLVCLLAVPLYLFRNALVRVLRISEDDFALIATVAVAAAAARLALLNHPDFYYPDLLTHARVVDAIRAAPLAFFSNPAAQLAEAGAWTKPVMGASVSLPYAVLFHSLFAIPATVFDWSHDSIERAFKIGGAAMSALPILLAAGLAARWRLSPLYALTLAIVPTYFSRLTFALLPALLGHVMDLVFLLWLASWRGDGSVASRRAYFVGVALLATAQLAYTSSVVNLGVAVAVAIVFALMRRQKARAIQLCVVGATASIVSVSLYYRSFLGDVTSLVTRAGIAGGAASGSVYERRGIVDFFLERSYDFFGLPLAFLALWGSWKILAKDERSSGSAEDRETMLVLLVSYVVLIVLRARIPDVFRYGHETTLVTPLAALVAAHGLRSGLASKTGMVKITAAGLGVWALVWAFSKHVTFLRDQLENAL